MRLRLPWQKHRGHLDRFVATISVNWEAPEPKAAPILVEQATPITGWRAYHMEQDGVLAGAAGFRWEGREFQAKCLRERLDGAPVRELCLEHLSAGQCSCGIHAAPSLTSPGLQPYIGASFYAQCSLYGTVAEGYDGNYRASDARIEVLHVMRNSLPLLKYLDEKRLLLDLELNYQVPVKVWDSFKALLAEHS